MRAKRNILLILVVMLTTLIVFAFREMLNMIVWGQGFEFLYTKPLDEFFSTLPLSLSNFQLSSVLLGLIGYKFFGINFQLYYWAWLLINIAIAIFLFILVYQATKNKLVAFSAALVNAVSYVSHMGLIGWIDTSFTGRVPNLLLLLPSFIYLHLFLVKKGQKYFVLSLIFYFLGLGFGQFGLLLSLWYICYPLLWYLFSSRKGNLHHLNLIKITLVSLSFVAVSAFFIKVHSSPINPAGPSYSFSYFLLNPKKYNYIEKVSIQLANWSNYPNLLKGLAVQQTSSLMPKITYSGTLRQHFSDINANSRVAVSIAVFYLFATIIIYFRLPKQRALLVSLVLTILAMFIQNVYIDHYKPEIQAGASRYLLYPTIMLSIFWALFLWAVFWKGKSKLLRMVGILIVALYYVINTIFVHETLNQLQTSKNSYYRKAVIMFSYIESNKSTLEPGTLVLTPAAELGCYEGIFLTEQVGDGKVSYWPDNANTNCKEFVSGFEELKINSKHIIKLDHDDICDCVVKNRIK